VPKRMMRWTLREVDEQLDGWHLRLPGVQSEMDANEMNARKN